MCTYVGKCTCGLHVQGKCAPLSASIRVACVFSIWARELGQKPRLMIMMTMMMIMTTLFLISCIEVFVYRLSLAAGVHAFWRLA